MGQSGKMQALSREARSNQRRLLTAFGLENDSDLLKFNQLKVFFLISGLVGKKKIRHWSYLFILMIFLVSKEAIEVWKIFDSRLGFVRFGTYCCRRDGYRIRRPGGQADFGRCPRNAIRSCRYWFLVSVPSRPRLYHRCYKVRQFGSIYQPFVQRKYFFFIMARAKS
jgi:hypothetical protein